MRPEFALLLRSLAIWLIIIAVEVLHGIFRTLYLMPYTGDLASRQIGVLTGSILILTIAYLTAGALRAETRAQQFTAGFLWCLLTFTFEIWLGRTAFAYTWAEIFADYHLLEGRLMLIGMAVLFAAPAFGARYGRSGRVAQSK